MMVIVVVAVVRHLFNAVNIGNKNILFNNGKKENWMATSINSRWN